jgi:putative acetyltransferase
MYIRNELASDHDAIRLLTMAAFEHHPFSRQTEHFIINALRKSDALALSLVAEIEAQVVGHIAFSRIEISDGTPDWYGIGPVSVLPDRQRKGVGKALMAEGLSKIREAGAKGCALVGPPDYYARFGFKNIPKLTHEGVPQEVFLVLPFESSIPQGSVTFHEAFRAVS